MLSAGATVILLYNNVDTDPTTAVIVLPVGDTKPGALISAADGVAILKLHHGGDTVTFVNELVSRNHPT